MRTFVHCPACNAERGVVVTVASEGCGPSRWSPAEAPTFDVIGLYAPCECGEALDTDALEAAAIDAALAELHERTEGR